MPSLAVLVLSLLRVWLSPIAIGGAAVVLAVARELTPRWPSSGFRWKIYDGLMVGLVLLLFVYAILKIQSA